VTLGKNMKTILSLVFLACGVLTATAQPPPMGGSIEWTPTPEKFYAASADKYKAFAEATVIHQPEPVKTKGPVYPFEAARSGVSGAVRVFALIDEKGYVTKVEVIDSTPKDIFDSATKTALKQWRFQKEARDKTPIQYVVDYVFVFKAH
jgi:TonB family protein